MSSVEILLREHVENLGRCGDVVKVKAGFARNYLLPRRLAVTATEENKRTMLRRRARLEVEEAARSAEIAQRIASISGLTLVTRGRADESGHLYGSVNAAAVALLLRAAGHTFAEGDVRLESPIRTLGAHVVRIHVHGEHHAEVTVQVEAETGTA